MSRKIAFTSLGCDKNRVDSEVMLGILQKNGYTAVADEAEADIIVVNTCCFIKDCGRLLRAEIRKGIFR